MTGSTSTAGNTRNDVGREQVLSVAGMPVIWIAGPTAVGKTALGVEVARLLGGEIISVDSRQVYRYMDIGTAKPTPEERSRAVHHFVDIVDPDERYNAGEFGREARLRIAQLERRGAAPVLVGGSGLYTGAVLDGFFVDDADHSADRASLEKQLEVEGFEPLLAELQRLDPSAARRLHRGDRQRVMRALELARSGGGLERRWQEQGEGALDQTVLAFCLNRSRQRLYEAIDGRVEAMMKAGLIEEVERLVESGYGDAPVMSTLGYYEVRQFLSGRLGRDAAVTTIQRRTRQYAKRQLTWFRRDRRLRWLDLDELGVRGVVDRIARRFDLVMQRTMRPAAGCHSIS